MANKCLSAAHGMWEGYGPDQMRVRASYAVHCLAVHRMGRTPDPMPHKAQAPDECP